MTTLFTEDGATSTVSTETVKEQDLVSALVGEGKKYKTVDELAKAYINADTFIEELKTENRQAREQLAKSKTLDEALQRLQADTTSKQEDKPVVTAPAVTEDSIRKLVEQTVTGLETARTKQENLLKADKAMKDMFGEKATEVFKAKATTPELQKVMTELAAASPEQFVALFKDGSTTTSKVDAGTSVNTTSSKIEPSSREKTVGTKEYFNFVRKNNPHLYYSDTFQLQMDKQVRSNPDLYFGN